MAVIAVTSHQPRNAKRYVEAIEKAGGEARLVLPGHTSPTNNPIPSDLLGGASGLLLPGGPDLDPQLYGEAIDPQTPLELSREQDHLELSALHQALELDLPVLAICRGMQLLNVAFGGKLLQDIDGHRLEGNNGSWAPSHHQVYVSPGSKLAAILGMGGFFRVNSIHHQGLRDAQRSARLLASAYSLEDGLVEGLESPEHSWVIGIQWHPERAEEVPKSFASLFASFVEWAERHEKRASI